MTNGRLLVFTEADLQILRDVIRAYRAGILQPRRASSHRVPQGPPPGRWAKIYSETGSGEYVCRLLERDASTETDPVRDVTAWEVNALEGIPVDEVVWLERDWSADEEEWQFAYELQAGTADVPAVILPAAFENETAQTDDWDRDAPPGGKDGVQIRVQMRTAYNDAGDETLYAFYRTLIYDSQGNLVTISAETRVSVDVAEACP